MKLSASFLPLLAACLISIPAFAANIEAPGVPNFDAVNDHIYRGAQPTDEGFKTLAKLGVKTVIDLRREGETGGHSIKEEQSAVEAAGMRYVSVPMAGLVAPSDQDVRKVLDILESGEPVFVHCRKGKDRTGTVIACYRIEHDGWTNKEAMKEAKDHGIHFIEFGMKRYISNYKAQSEKAAGKASAQPSNSFVPQAAPALP